MDKPKLIKGKIDGEQPAWITKETEHYIFVLFPDGCCNIYHKSNTTFVPDPDQPEEFPIEGCRVWDNLSDGQRCYGNHGPYVVMGKHRGKYIATHERAGTSSQYLSWDGYEKIKNPNPNP